MTCNLQEVFVLIPKQEDQDKPKIMDLFKVNFTDHKEVDWPKIDLDFQEFQQVIHDVNEI